MDMITLTLAVKKALEELGVKNEKTQSALTWDGNYDDVVMVMGALPMGKISDNHVDLNSVDSIVVRYENGDTKMLTASDWIIHAENGIQTLLTKEDETPYVISSPVEVEGVTGKGVYFAYAIGYYVEKITYTTETIHPIDPKFIPGAVLPVVELSSFPSFPDEPVEPTAEEIAVLESVLALDTKYALFDIALNEFGYCHIAKKVYVDGVPLGFIGHIHPAGFDTAALLMAIKEDGAWMVMLAETL